MTDAIKCTMDDVYDGKTGEKLGECNNPVKYIITSKDGTASGFCVEHSKSANWDWVRRALRENGGKLEVLD